MIAYTFIDDEKKLKQAAEIWKKSKDLAIDLECENNLHHYGSYISLIQISNKETNWIVDVLKLKNIKPLVKILHGQDIQKIFHDVGFDFRILKEQFECHPKPVFDTQIAALLLGKENIGLGSLLEEYLDVKKESKFQMADWTIRPLTEKMLSYAVKDTLHLIKLRDILKKELEEKGRLTWAEEEFKYLETCKFGYKEQTFLDIKKSKELSPKQLGVLNRLFLLRKKLAKLVDRPVHFVINNKRLREFSIDPPDWRHIRGVHPIVRQSAELFKKAVKEGKEEPVNVEKRERKFYTAKQKDFFEKINEIQKKAAEKLGIKGHLIINKEQASKIVNGEKDCLKKWQQKILEKEGLKL